MSIPTTYSEWVNLLEKFGNGDDTALGELAKGTFSVDAGTASRFYSRVEEVYKKRKQDWLYKFQRSFQLQNFKTVDDFEMALRNGKQNLSPLSRFIGIQGLPEDLRKTLRKDLEDFVQEIQNSLKQNLFKISNNREQMLILLNSFDLFDITETSRKEKEDHKKTRSERGPLTGRKIIFQDGK